MKLLSLMSSGVFLIMNIATAAPEQFVSYHSTRVNGLEIFYREAGPKDAPTILLLHGLPSSSRMYQSLLESSLSEKYRHRARLSRFRSFLLAKSQGVPLYLRFSR